MKKLSRSAPEASSAVLLYLDEGISALSPGVQHPLLLSSHHLCLEPAGPSTRRHGQRSAPGSEILHLRHPGVLLRYVLSALVLTATRCTDTRPQRCVRVSTNLSPFLTHGELRCCRRLGLDHQFGQRISLRESKDARYGLRAIDTQIDLEDALDAC